MVTIEFYSNFTSHIAFDNNHVSNYSLYIQLFEKYNKIVKIEKSNDLSDRDLCNDNWHCTVKKRNSFSSRNKVYENIISSKLPTIPKRVPLSSEPNSFPKFKKAFLKHSFL